MSELFDIPETPEPRFTRARKRYEAAMAEYNEAARIDEDCDGFGESAYLDLRDKAAAARRELEEAERERVGR
jgi:hypothetical protein